MVWCSTVPAKNIWCYYTCLATVVDIFQNCCFVVLKDECEEWENLGKQEKSNFSEILNEIFKNNIVQEHEIMTQTEEI